jgi:hypothetical protein
MVEVAAESLPDSTSRNWGAAGGLRRPQEVAIPRSETVIPRSKIALVLSKTVILRSETVILRSEATKNLRLQ